MRVNMSVARSFKTTQPLSSFKSFDTTGFAGFIFKTFSESVKNNHCDCVIKGGSKRGKRYPVSKTAQIINCLNYSNSF